MNQVPDFLKHAQDDSNDVGMDEMLELKNLVETYDEYSKLVENLEEQLKTAKASFNRVSSELIPTFLNQHGFEEFKLLDGRKVTVKKDISVSVKDFQAFKKFLADRHELDIVKINCAFDRMPDTMMNELFDFLNKGEYSFALDESVHHQTQKKYFKELLNTMNRTDLPDWVSIFDIVSTKIK